MWQVSDDVEPEVITAVSKDCSDECKFSARIQGTTLMATVHHYDKNGVKHIYDPNNKEVSVECGKCWKEFRVNVQPNYDETGAYIGKKYIVNLHK